MKKKQFFDQVLEEVRAIPIKEIVKAKYEIPNGKCPFHHDRHAGSFSVSNRHRTYTCWSCGATGDGINFVQEMEQITFPEAVLKIALLFELITDDQANFYLFGKETEFKIQKEIKKYDGYLVETEEGERADEEVIHNVYSLFAEGESILKDTPKLRNEHMSHLLNERSMTSESIEKIGFFTIPSRSRYYMRTFLLELKNRFQYEPDVLVGVPGFYQFTKDDSFTFASQSGLGIPVKNGDGLYVGIQIRKDIVSDNGQRYIWFSSGFAIEKEELKSGTGSGSPIHVSEPFHVNYPKLVMLTEGIFKSEELAKEYETYGLSIQGVLNWKDFLLKEIESIEKKEKENIEYLYFMFDSDISENVNVFFAVKNIYEYLKENRPNIKMTICWWDEIFGKGADDVLKKGHKNQIKKMEMESFVKEYEDMIAILESDTDLPIRKIYEMDKTLIKDAFDEQIKPIFLKNN